KIIEKISAGDSYGISGMSERVSMLGGNFKILSIKEKGTKINIEIPLKNEKEK
ncbi:MAG: sensor histidine kinase, partial [Armatimonadetes bacterium]|nr:sensor histidine kinase [Armatimonadota bacterium]